MSCKVSSSMQALLRVDTITVLYVILILITITSRLTVVPEVVRRDGIALMTRMSLILVQIRSPLNASEGQQMVAKMKKTELVMP